MPRRPLFPASSPLRSRRLVRLERRLPGRQTNLPRFQSALTARAGGKTLGGPLPGGRITRPLGVLVAGALLFVGARYFLGQGFGFVPAIEGAARAQYIPMLEKQLGAKIEVGEFSTDWRGRLQVENLVVGRDAKLPTGALLRARRATISFDLIGLLSRRKTPLTALQSVNLEAPQVYIERDARGKINLQSLVKRGDDGPSVEWDGQVTLQEGRVYYRDFAQKSRSGDRLEIDATGVAGTFYSRPRAPFRFTALVGEALLVSKNLRLRNLPFGGFFQSQPDLRGAVSTRLPAIPLAVAGDFAFPRGDVVARNGTVAGAVRISVAPRKTTPSGALRFQDADLELPSQRLPRGGQPRAGETVRVQNLNGDAIFADSAFESQNLRARILGADWKLAGRAFIPGRSTTPPVFDVRLQSDSLPVARLLSLADPRQLPRELAIEKAGLDAQIAGTPQNLSVAGTLNLGATRAQLPPGIGAVRNGRAQFSGARALFAVALAPNTPVRFSARVASPLSQVSGAVRVGNGFQNGTFRARDAVFEVAGAARNAPFEIEVRARSWNVQSSRLGQTSGRDLRLLASTPTLQNPNFRGQAETRGIPTRGLSFAELSPAARRILGETGTLGARASFGGIGTKTPFFEADATLSRLTLNRAALPESLRARVPASVLALDNLRAQISFSGGQLRVQNARAASVVGEIRAALAEQNIEVELPLAALPEREIDEFLASRGLGLRGQIRGRVALSTSLQPNSPLNARFQIGAPRAVLLSRGAQRLSLENPILRGQIRVAPGRSWRGEAFLFAREIGVQSGGIGNLNVGVPAALRGLRVGNARLELAGSGDFAGDSAPIWSARLALPRLTAPLPISGSGGAPRFVTLRDAVVLADGRRRGVVQITRARARFGQGTLDATGEVSGNGFGGAVLARGFESAELQRLLAPQTLREARLSGRVAARAEIAPGVAPVLSVQMQRGRVFVPAQNLSLPISALRGEGQLLENRAILRDLRFWSEGAFFTASGELPLALSKPPTRTVSLPPGEAPQTAETPRNTSPFALTSLLPPVFPSADAVAAPAPTATPATQTATPLPLNQAALAGASLRGGTGKLSVRGLRLARLPLSRELKARAALDGIFSGDFSLRLGEEIELEGEAKLDGATAVGADIGATSGRVEVRRDETGGWRFALPDWSGRVEGAKFQADLESDLAQNYWRVTFSTPEIAARRVALLQTRTAKRLGQPQEGTLPLEGDFFADLDLNGEFRPRAGEEKRPFWLPRAGYAILRSQNVRWRGRNAGSFDADFSIAGDLARIRKFELNPPGENERGAPAIKVSGVLPLSPNDKRLNARLEVGQAPLEFFRDTVREARLGLQALDIRLAALDQAVNYSQTLPVGLQGQIAVKAEATGSWGAPSVRVSDLELREGRVPLPQGGLSAPATLDAAFSFEGGAISIQESTFQIAKTAAEKLTEDEDDTLLRVEKGGVTTDGKIDVRADIFNVNLAQIATWVPALRDENGAALLKGSVPDFSVALGGTTQNPEVTGSLTAENLAFGGYSLDRFLISRFDIKNGVASIEPGNLSLVKGGYTSRSAWGRLPVDFRRGGVLRNAPFEVHLPLETRDFTAVAGILLPGLRNLRASEIKGDLNVGGTLDAPRFEGDLRLREVGFSVGNSVGLSKLNGTVRFVDGNRLAFDGDDPLRGEVGRAEVAAPPARPARGAKVTNAASAPNFDVSGAFTLGGGITFDLSPRNFARPLQSLSRHYYDLRFGLSNAAFSSPLISGFREGEAAVRFRTEGQGGAPNLKWMLWARGQRVNRKSAGGGFVQSVGNLRLASDFGGGFRALARSQAQEFGDGSEFSEFPVAKRIDISKLPDRRPQFDFSRLEWSYTGVGRGELNGRLVLDNREEIQPTPNVQLLQNAKVRPPLAQSLLAQLQRERTNPFDNTPLEKKSWLRFQIGDERRVRTPVEEQLFGFSPEEVDDATTQPQRGEFLRLGGQMTLQNAEITGAPSGEGGTPARLSSLPFAPRFDTRIVIGENVNFLTSVFRTGITGELVASGTPRNPQIVGTVELREGQIRFPNARARISEGRLQVAVTRDPETDLLRSRVDVDAEATGQSGIYQINLKLRGPLDLGEGQEQNGRLQVDVTTSPSLSQDIAFAQLLGIAPNATENGGGFDSGRANQAYAEAVLQFVAAPFFSGFERSIASALGLDSVGFEYRFSEALAIQLSKNVGDRVIISYRRSIGGSEQAQSTTRRDAVSPEELRIDYRVKGDFLVGLNWKQFQDRSTVGVSVQRTWRF